MKIDTRIFGGFNVKVGNIVGLTWKDKSKPSSSEKKASKKQINHRAQFMYAAKFL